MTRYETWNVLWTAGVEAPPLATAVAAATGAQQDRAGRIVVGPDLSIAGHPEILVTGDVMSLDKLPGVAEVAMQTGLYAGRSIAHQAQGKSFDKPFKYRDLGSAAYISRGKAVVSAFKLNFGGFAGLVGLAVHPHRLPHRLPQPRRRRPRLVVRVHPRHAPRTHLHHRRHAGGRGPVRRQPARSRGYRRAQRAR